MGKEILSRSQLKRLAEHKYSVTGVSLLEPFMQRFWKWIVLQIPESWAPNAMTLAGLVVNVVTTAVLMIYSPDAKKQAPWWSYVLCAGGLFIYQTLDAIDGKQARRIHCSSALGELFDHGCDALSIVFVVIGTCIALELGLSPRLMVFECLATMFLFYVAHWQAYCSGFLKFGLIDVTEGQISITVLYLLCALFGSSFWSYELPVIAIQLKMLPLFFGFIGAALACYSNFYTIFMQGGVGKNGSTVAGTSVLSPLGPIGLLIGLAVTIWMKSPSDIFQNHIVLYVVSFGMASSKIANKLVIAHMSRTEMGLLDTSLIGPGLLFLNQYFDTFFSELFVLWICFDTKPDIDILHNLATSTVDNFSGSHQYMQPSVMIEQLNLPRLTKMHNVYMDTEFYGNSWSTGLPDEKVSVGNAAIGDHAVPLGSSGQSTGREARYACGFCRKTFPRAVLLQLHVRIHGVRRPFTCTRCCRSFRSRAELAAHNCTHPWHNFECEICHRKFRRHDCFRIHMHSHAEERPYACDVCKKRFLRVAHLNSHRHGRLRPFRCKLCCRKFSRLGFLRSHMIVHTRVPYFACGTCERRFFRLWELRVHTRTHARERPIVCQTCLKRFRYKKHYDEHAKNHLASKFTCEICREQFTRSDLMKCHLLQHAKQQMHSCNVCLEAFATAGELSEHAKSHASEQTLACQLCSRSFVDERMFESHMRLHSRLQKLYHRS